MFENDVVAWETALWFWMNTDSKYRRSLHEIFLEGFGFAVTTDIINGALECDVSKPSSANEAHRIDLYTSAS